MSCSSCSGSGGASSTPIADSMPGSPENDLKRMVKDLVEDMKMASANMKASSGG